MRFASSSCKNKAYYRRKLNRGEAVAFGPQHCRECGNAFTPTVKTQRYCLGECRVVSGKKLRAEQEARKKLRSITKSLQAIANSVADPKNFAFELRQLFEAVELLK